MKKVVRYYTDYPINEKVSVCNEYEINVLSYDGNKYVRVEYLDVDGKVIEGATPEIKLGYVYTYGFDGKKKQLRSKQALVFPQFVGAKQPTRKQVQMARRQYKIDELKVKYTIEAPASQLFFSSKKAALRKFRALVNAYKTSHNFNLLKTKGHFGRTLISSTQDANVFVEIRNHKYLLSNKDYKYLMT